MASKEQKVKAEFENAILHGLPWEWEQVVRRLPVEVRNKLKTPTFSIRDMSPLGRYFRFTNEIALSRALVSQYAHHDVIETLKHEVAHQLAMSEGGADEPPHGPRFQEACRRLFADPRASVRVKPLEQLMQDEEKFHASNHDRLLLKVRKLFALGASTNAHEAELALEKAFRLIEKHNLEMEEAQHTKAEDYVSVLLGTPKGRHSKAEYLMDRMIRDYYFCQTVWVSAFVFQTGKPVVHWKYSEEDTTSS